MMRHAARRLLAWYDVHARALPWRSPPGGEPADTYHVWLSEVMLQQTTVAAVTPRFTAWVARWPTVEALAAADEADVLGQWAGLGYYARARNLHAAARAVVAMGQFPRDESGLRDLPGIGDYTAAAIATIAFGRVAVPVDANIARVGARLLGDDPSPATLRARLVPLFAGRPGDVAQALMDVGSSICTSRAPACYACPLADDCAAAAAGTPDRWPARKTKTPRPTRHGTVFWLEAGDHVLLVRRPPHGLLGGMASLPTSDWAEAVSDPLAQAPAPADWRILKARVAHAFTHFHLDLGIARAEVRSRPDIAGEWVLVAGLDRAGLPTVFAKAAALAQC
jgi:A/G-specific adenine glycosylase